MTEGLRVLFEPDPKMLGVHGHGTPEALLTVSKKAKVLVFKHCKFLCKS